jgi:O-antigen/teichoic acid export membrane protein
VSEDFPDAPERPVEEAREGDGRRRRSMFSATLFTYGTNAAVSVLSLANVLIVARVLGAHARGEVAFLITVSTLTAQVAGLSVQEANANLAGSEPALRPRLATNSLVLALACGAAAAVVVEGLVSIFPAVGGPVPVSLLWTALAVIPIVIARTSFSFLLQAEYAFGPTNAAWLVGPLSSVTGNAILAVIGKITVTAAFATWIGGQIIGLVIMLVYVARRSGFGRIDLSLARRALSFGLRTHPGRLMGVGNYRADQWLVGSISGSRALGLYSVAVAWADLLFYVPGVLTLVQRPDLVRATRENAARQAARVFRVALLLSSVAALALIVLAPFLCTVVFGHEFADSTNQLRVLALGCLGITAIDLLPNALTAQRMPIRGTGGIAVAFVVMLALDIVLIPPFAGLGAAAATAIAYTAGGIVALMIFVRALHCDARDLVPRATEVRWLWRKMQALRSRA